MIVLPRVVSPVIYNDDAIAFSCVHVATALVLGSHLLCVCVRVCVRAQLVVTYLAFCGMAISNALAIDAYTREYERNKVNSTYRQPFCSVA